MSRTRAGGLALVLLLATASLIGAVGGAAAADVEVTNETVAVDNETRSVYADLNATSNVSGDANFTVSFESVNESGNVTGTLDTRNVSVGSGNTSLVEYSDVNASNYSEVSVTVKVNNSTASTSNVSAEIGTIQMVAGSSGGGFSLDGMGQTEKIGLGVVVLVVVGMLLSGDSED